jgi:hypothetical protein
MLKSRIDQDLKAALLAGDKDRVTTLRGLKSAILYVEVAKGVREQGLPDSEIVEVLSREAKKRQESADLYVKGGSEDKAKFELAEKQVIETYLPSQLSDDELQKVVETTITEIAATGPSAMGQVIGAVKAKTAGQAEGARIAQIVKDRLA